ncbi:ankyrin, partial [Tuber magnatum]
DARDQEGLSPPFTATYCGLPEVVKPLLKQESVDINAVLNRGSSTEVYTLLLIAAEEDEVEIVQLPLEGPAPDVGVQDHAYSTALHHSVGFGREEVVLALLADRRLNVNILNLLGGTALHAAAQCDSEGTVKAMLEDDRFNVNHRKQEGDPPLHLAANMGHGRVVQMLLEGKRVDPEIEGDNGDRPLHYAARYGHRNVAGALLDDARINLNSVGGYYKTPLHYAVIGDSSSVIPLLLANQ